MSNKTTTETTNPLESFQKSQPSVSEILTPPKRKVELADANPYPASLAGQRAIDNLFVWKAGNLNEENRYMEVLNCFMSFVADQKYLSKENESDKDEPIEKLAIAFVSFKVDLAEDSVTRLVTKIPFRGADIASAMLTVNAKEFLAQAEISNEGNALAREAEDCRRSQRSGMGSLVRM